MKWTLSLLFLMTLIVASCGNNNQSNNGSSLNGYGTQTGYYDLSTQVIQVGATTYPPSQQYAILVNQALQQAQMRNVQPVMINGSRKLRARVTFQNPNTGYSNGYQQGLIMTAIQFY